MEQTQFDHKIRLSEVKDFRDICVKLAHVLLALYKLDRTLKDKPKKRLTVQDWVDIGLGDVLYLMLPPLLHYLYNNKDRSQFETVEKLYSKLTDVRRRIQDIKLQRTNGLIWS